MKLIIANTDTILEASETLTELPDRWLTPNAQYSKTLVTSIEEVDTLPNSFDTRYCIWNGTEIVCTLPEPQIVKVSEIPVREFMAYLEEVLGETLTYSILFTPSRISAIFWTSTKIGYADVFDCVDGDPSRPGYAKLLLAAQVVSQAQVTALEARWRTEPIMEV